MADKIEVSKKVYDGVVFYLDTLFEGCDLTKEVIDEISCDYGRLYHLLVEFKGKNIEDVKGKILSHLEINLRSIG